MARSSQPLTVTLGGMKKRVDARVKSGAYASASEVLRAAVRALDREEAIATEALRQQIDSALSDPRRDVSAADAFAKVRAHHARKTKRRA